ncbi:hypothetical protein CSIM01_08787 [Colletotrichum simmondsii]|uniref:Uncharacterized protein n=1 Tax=Colletotrichum simmondsii TaxID=703756 RepID=A0A135T8L1_9PEZI|nr:hypothetical protein CSIM01_08787 [Colletotrichum simmondsii]
MEPMKSRLRELQAVVDRADMFAKWAMTSRQARDGINTHVGICTQNIDKLKWDLGQHTAKNCWAAGSNLMFKDATLSPEPEKRKGDLLDEMYLSILFDLITAPEKSAPSFNRQAASPPPPYNAPAVYGKVDAFAKPAPPPPARNPAAP